MILAGVISSILGIAMTTLAISDQDYVWLIGTIPLTIMGIVLVVSSLFQNKTSEVENE